MRSREQVIWDFVQEWIRKAEKDIITAEILLKSGLEDYFKLAEKAFQEANLVRNVVLKRLKEYLS